MVEQLTRTPEEEHGDVPKEDSRTPDQKRAALAGYRILYHNTDKLSPSNYSDYIALLVEEQRDFQASGPLTSSEWEDYLEVSKKSSGGTADENEIKKFVTLHSRLEKFGKADS